MSFTLPLQKTRQVTRNSFLTKKDLIELYKKALRVVLYIAKNKIDWYNENGLHTLVLEALYPVIVNNLVKDQGLSLQKRQKEGEANRIIESKV
jgi:hypothetical protein